MSVMKEYIREIDRELKYLTYKDGSSCIIIDKRDFFSIIYGAYYSGYIKCIKDINHEKYKFNSFLNSSTQMGGYNMDMNVILERIDKLDNKYDSKLDDIRESIHLLDKKVDSMETKLNSVDEDLKTMKKEQDDKKKFWTKDVWVPIITGVITGVLSTVTATIIISKLIEQ